MVESIKEEIEELKECYDEECQKIIFFTIGELRFFAVCYIQMRTNRTQRFAAFIPVENLAAWGNVTDSNDGSCVALSH